MANKVRLGKQKMATIGGRPRNMAGDKGDFKNALDKYSLLEKEKPWKKLRKPIYNIFSVTVGTQQTHNFNEKRLTIFRCRNPYYRYSPAKDLLPRTEVDLIALKKYNSRCKYL